ncbi:ATP-dependent Clp protease proteolytic subunit [Rhizobium sp. RAF56]|uniref:ATP-dependent Clp protease proteolytic subunit n=1 Tax=Rhizobium sp. RAF56 TaxID=3233062 RepID=UPI003F97C9B6
MDMSYRGDRADPRRTIAMRGSIVPGDAERLRAMVKDLPSGKKLIGFSIVSDGGDVQTAMELMDVFDEVKVPVMIMGWCASACGYIAADAAAHGHLYLAREADVRVHRDADDSGKDDPADSAAVAQVLRERGVPASIASKIVSTPSAKLASITADLIEMGAQID